MGDFVETLVSIALFPLFRRDPLFNGKIEVMRSLY
jgi:hypothetical protein